MTNLTKYSTVDSPVDTLFNRLFPAFDRVLAPVNGEWTANRVPRANIYELPQSYIVKLEMPGLSRENVEISIEGDELKVSGQAPIEVEGAQILHDEVRSARFERVFNVLHGVDRNQIKASMQNGVLTITLVKAPEHVGRKITIE